MKRRDLTLDLLQELTAELASEAAHKTHMPSPTSGLTIRRKNATPQTEAEVRKLTEALQYLSPDVPRGHGAFYDTGGRPNSDYWLAAVWAIASLGWPDGERFARGWSKSSDRYTDEGFEQAWSGYNPSHPNAVGVGSLYKRAHELGWRYANTPPATGSTSRFRLVSGADVKAKPPITWRIKGIFPATGLAALYGPAASGKSFLGFDCACCIADGISWFGLKTSAAPVVYVALEGEAGYRLRVEAWEKARSKALPQNLYLVLQPFRLSEPADIEDLAAVIPKGAVTFIDTLNRAAPTMDENNSRDMGAVLEATKRLQELTGGLVVLVAHSGKDASKGVRGHSSLFAALDAGIEVERTATGRAWTITKSKDAGDGQRLFFRLVVHDLGADPDGDKQTSCTVEQDSRHVFQASLPSGKDQRAAFNLLRAEIAASTEVSRAGSGALTRCVRVEDAITKIAGNLPTVQANKRKNRARTILKGLIDGAHLQSGLEGDEGWVWLP